MKSIDFGALKQKINMNAVVFAILIGLSIIGVVYVKTEKRKQIRLKRNELTEINEHKISQIKLWMKERVADANHFSVSPLYADALLRWIQTGDSSIGAQLGQRNQLIRNLRGFKDVMMVVGDKPMVFPHDVTHRELSNQLKELVKASQTQKGIHFTSFTADSSGTETYIGLCAPIYKDKEPPFAALLFLIDPTDFLFTIVGKPSHIPSASLPVTWLLERADGVIYDVKEIPQDALLSSNVPYSSISDSDQIPLTVVYRSDLGPSGSNAHAIMNFGTIKNGDGRFKDADKRMLSVVEPINGTPWVLLTMQEEQIVVRPIYWMAGLMGAMVVAVLLLLGLGLRLIEKRRNQSHLEELLRKEQKSRLLAQAAEARIRDVVDNSFDAVLFFEADGKVVYVSDKVKAYLGLDLTDWSTCLVWELFDDKSALAIINDLQDIHDRGKPFSYSVKMKIANAEWHWVEASFHQMDNTLLPGAWVLNIMDVHERRLTQEKLNDLRIFQATIVENAGYAIISSDKAGTITLFNKAAEEMFGYKSAEMVGLLTPLTLHSIPEIEQQAFALSKKLSIDVKPGFDVFVLELNYYQPDEKEWTFVRKDGSTFIGALKVSLLKDAEGNVTGYMGVIVDLTIRKAQEQRMKDQDILLRDYHKVAKLGAYKLDTVAGKWVGTDVLDDIFGIPHGSVMDVEGWSNLVYADDKAMMLAYFANEVLAHHHPFDKKYRIVRQSDREIRWVHGLGELEFGPNGQVLSMIGTIRDITEQVKIEEAIKLSEQRYQKLFENMSGGFALLDTVVGDEGAMLDFRFIEVNPTLEAIVKSSRDKLLGHSIGEMGGDEPSFWIEKFSNVVASGQSDKFVRYLQASNIYLEAIIFTPIPNQVALILYDVTERILTDIKLKESEQKFAIFYNLNPDAAGITRFADGVMLDINPAFSQLLEFTPDECLGKTTMELGLWYNPEDRVLMSQVLTENGVVDNYEFKARAKSGKLLETLFSSKRIKYKGEDCMLFIVRDITDRKRHEDQIKLLNEQLERKVEERTCQLEQANRDLEAFSYSVSHDLRAPLRHVDGFVRLLFAQIQQPSDTIKSYFDKINASSHRMSLMIDDLLQFSRLGRKEIAYTKVDMRLVVDEIIEQMLPDLSNRQVEWVIGDLPVVEGDRGLLRTAFENLLGNAVKYTSKQPLAVIELGSRVASPGKVEIFVKDNGVGFNMAYVDKLFGVFQRLHSAEEFDGTGIGLANVKRIVQRHGGDIKVEAALNQGATFFVTLNALN